MLPMGTIMATSMVIAVFSATRLPMIGLIQKLPETIKKLIAGYVFLAGSWNVLWYASQHITEFWGQAALVSGVLMWLSAGYIGWSDRLPNWLHTMRPLVLLSLTGCALLYGITIYQM